MDKATRSEAAERRGREEAGTHTGTETCGFGEGGSDGVARSRPAPRPHSGGGGAMVETIWIPRSDGERDGRGMRHAWLQSSASEVGRASRAWEPGAAVASFPPLRGPRSRLHLLGLQR